MRKWVPAAIAVSFLFAGCGGGGSEGPSVPSTISGGFSLTFTRQAGTSQLGLIGAFQQDAKAIGSFADMFNVTEVGDGECATLPSRDLFANGPMVDAGEFLDLVTPGGNLQVSRSSFNGQPIYVSNSSDTTHFAADGGYTLTGTGGDDIGSFTADFSAPGDLTVTSPDLTQELNVDRTLDLTLQWSSSGTGSPLVVIIRQSDANGATTLEKACSFADDGDAVITAATLGEFDETLPGFFDGITLMKQRSGTFSHPELEAPLMIFTSSAWASGITLE